MIPHTNEIKAKHKFFLVDVGSSKNILTHNFIFLTQGFKLCGTVRFWNGYKLLDSSSKVMGCTRSIENNKLWSVLLPIMVQMVIKKKQSLMKRRFHFTLASVWGQNNCVTSTLQVFLPVVCFLKQRTIVNPPRSKKKKGKIGNQDKPFFLLRS